MRKRFILITILALIVIVGGVGIGLAWKTKYLDKWLPPNIKEMFGRGEKPEEEPQEGPAEGPEEEPEEAPEEGPEKEAETKPWKTYENKSFGISFKYPKTYQITKEEGIGVGKFDGKFILSDKTRSGNPELQMWFNPDGFGGICMNDIFYETAIEDGKVGVLKRRFEDRAKTSPCNEYTLDTWTVIFNLTFVKSSGPACPFGEGKYCSIVIFYDFLRSGPDYEPEFRQIIETIRMKNCLEYKGF